MAEVAAELADETLVAAQVLLTHCQQLVILSADPGHLVARHHYSVPIEPIRRSRRRQQRGRWCVSVKLAEETAKKRRG